MSRSNDPWQERSACLPLMSDDPGAWDTIFYGDTTADRAPAKDVCSSCPVRLDCLSDALDRGEVWGVWGGCDEVDLRRALWVDSSGTKRPRLRFPRCPLCRGRSETLFVRSSCSLEGGAVSEAVECSACSFSWSAETSVAAVKLFWETRPEKATVVPIKRAARVRVPRGRIPSGTSSRRRSAVQHPTAAEAPVEPVRALAASAAQGQG